METPLKTNIGNISDDPRWEEDLFVPTFKEQQTGMRDPVLEDARAKRAEQIRADYQQPVTSVTAPAAAVDHEAATEDRIIESQQDYDPVPGLVDTVDVNAPRYPNADQPHIPDHEY